jgi:hypothetical protein
VLDVDVLADYTKGRLDADADETARLLDSAVAAVRRWCGWHVAPELTQTETVDGPGGALLRLPSLRVVALSAVTEDGVDLDLAGLEWSRIGLVRKKSGGLWTSRFQGITVTMSHGFADAADFETAVYSVADHMSQAADGGAPTVVGPFRWGNADSPDAGFTTAELLILEQYRLERAA